MVVVKSCRIIEALMYGMMPRQKRNGCMRPPVMIEMKSRYPPRPPPEAVFASLLRYSTAVPGIGMYMPRR